MVGLSAFGVYWRATTSTSTASRAASIAAWGGGLVGDRRPRSSPLSIHATAATGTRLAVDHVISHPVATLTLTGTRLLGWPVRRSILAAIAFDHLLPVVAARHPAPSARFLRLWTLACRFRRRWPGSLHQAERALGRQLSVGPSTTRTDTGPEAADPQRSVPSLARLPHRIEGTTVAWAIELDPTTDPIGLGRHVGQLSLLDPRILSVEVERRSVGANGRANDLSNADWEVVVDFDIEPPPWALSTLGEGQVLASIDSTAWSNRWHEEGGSHGNG